MMLTLDAVPLPGVHPIGLVPGIHVPPPPRPLPARTTMPQDVDARNKSGHDDIGTGRAVWPATERGAETSGAPTSPLWQIYPKTRPESSRKCLFRINHSLSHGFNEVFSSFRFCPGNAPGPPNPSHARFRRDFPLTLTLSPAGRGDAAADSSVHLLPSRLREGLGEGGPPGTDRIDRQRKRGAGISSGAPTSPLCEIWVGSCPGSRVIFSFRSFSAVSGFRPSPLLSPRSKSRHDGGRDSSTSCREVSKDPVPFPLCRRQGMLVV